jgi:hypothetical protein
MSPMNEDYQKFYMAAKALIEYVVVEDVFDRSADMGCGGFDTSQSETFYNLIADARKALKKFEEAMKVSESA